MPSACAFLGTFWADLCVAACLLARSPRVRCAVARVHLPVLHRLCFTVSQHVCLHGVPQTHRDLPPCAPECNICMALAAGAPLSVPRRVHIPGCGKGCRMLCVWQGWQHFEMSVLVWR